VCFLSKERCSGGKKTTARMMFGNPPQTPASARRRKRQNLEFDFAGLSAVARRPRKAKPSVEPKAADDTISAESAPTGPEEAFGSHAISAREAALAASRPEVLGIPRAIPLSNSNPNPTSPTQPQPTKEIPMATTTPNPSPISATRSIDRQVREQRALSTLLHGAGLALVSTILVVAGLAALGGYVLYKQLQDQSATVALLEQSTKQRMFELEMDLTRRDTELAKNLEQSNLRLTGLTAQFEEHRFQTTQTLAELRARNRELERLLSLYQKKLNDQQSAIARLR
jgi:hypothetical protein